LPKTVAYASEQNTNDNASRNGILRMSNPS
jgi:hypothetical protein